MTANFCPRWSENHLIRAVGRIAELSAKTSVEGTTGIRTLGAHGKPTEVMLPLRLNVFVLVHNRVIENYMKSGRIPHRSPLQSETDTEICIHC